MRTQITALLSGFGLAIAGAFAIQKFAKRELMKWGATPDRESALRLRSRFARDEIDLNAATREQLASLGIEDAAVLERILDNRPYRHKLDLVSRLVVSRDIYNRIKNRIRVHAPRPALKMAS